MTEGSARSVSWFLVGIFWLVCKFCARLGVSRGNVLIAFMCYVDKNVWPAGRCRWFCFELRHR